MGREFDFSGYATRNDLLCGDGRIIRRDAFKHCDGTTVPLIWNHDHSKSEAVIGHALLENREDGVYAYGKLNDTKSGLNARALIKNGDVRSLSIYANKLKQNGNEVIHGTIRELSLVLAGANPGAYIDFVMAHDSDSEAALYANYDENALVIYHSDDNEAKGDNEMEEKQMFTKEQEEMIHGMISQAVADATAKQEEEVIQHAEEKKEKTIADVFETLNEEQKTVVYALIGEALNAEGEEDEEDDEEVEGGKTDMKHNVFDQEANYNEEVLSHSEMKAIFEDAKRCGSLKEAVIQHGIEDLELMFPDNRALEKEPGFIKRNDDWVAKVLGGVHHTPFARIKSVFADITKDQARAKGYTKGNLKIEEVFKLLKRTTNPTTVYKKQKLDRDDMLDMDFDVLPWLKKEIRMMLNEEMARAFLIGDGRDPVEEANDKIDEECIRPIWKMEDLFTVKHSIDAATATTDAQKAKAFIRAAVQSRKNYKGSGNPVMFMSEDMLTNCLLLEDKNERIIYDTEAKLAAALRVREIVPVPVMEGDAVKRTDDDGNIYELAGLYVNLNDYNVGTDKGGEINFFDDFDIDYNQMKYLMETRCSGSLTKPHSAVAIEFKTAKA